MQRASFAREDILEVGEPFYYYTSPGGINERVKACPVQVRPRLSASAPFPNYTQFTDAGTVRELDAIQVLRACHVGGMFDARIEINIYHLLRLLGRKAGPWIGAPVKLSLQSAELSPHTDECLLAPSQVAAFEPCPPRDESDFLSIKEGLFAERDRDGSVLAQVPFEYVLPRNLSLSTVAALPVAKTNGGTFIGIQLRDLPAVQAFSGSSKIATAPAWRLPRAVRHWTELPAFLGEAMRRDFNLRIRHVWELGGSYMPSPGVTPETVYPFVAEIEAHDITGSGLHFIELTDLKNSIDVIQEGHLLITACRLIHSLD